MVGNTLADSMAITASRRTFELTRRRAITTEDMGYMLNLAMPPHNAREVVVTRLEFGVGCGRCTSALSGRRIRLPPNCYRRVAIGGL